MYNHTVKNNARMVGKKKKKMAKVFSRRNPFTAVVEPRYLRRGSRDEGSGFTDCCENRNWSAVDECGRCLLLLFLVLPAGRL